MSDYRARAGALTLMYVAGSAERHVLLELLAEAMADRELRELDPRALPDPEDVMDPGLGPAALAPVGGLPIGPDTPMTITPAGREMLYVASVLERWLRNCPDGPLEFGEEPAAAATAALVYGWSATAMHALAREPLSLPEMSRAIRAVSYRTLEEHVDTMEAVGEVEARPENGAGARYAVTDWLREGIAPLAAAARLECHYPAPDTAPADGLDIEAGFLLTLPLLRLPVEVAGVCRLGIRLEDDLRLTGVTARVEDGRVVSCVPHLDEDADTWASGSLVDWLDTLVDPSSDLIEAGGDTELAATLLAGLHEALFGVPAL